MYRDVGGVDAGVEGQADNPFQFEEVKAKINEGLAQHGFTDGKEYVVVKVPNIIDISYGTAAGFPYPTFFFPYRLTLTLHCSA